VQDMPESGLALDHCFAGCVLWSPAHVSEQSASEASGVMSLEFAPSSDDALGQRVGSALPSRRPLHPAAVSAYPQGSGLPVSEVEALSRVASS
jgi:hypothetical protein